MKQYIRAEEEYNADEAFSGDVDNRRKWARSTNSEELLGIYCYDPDYRVRESAASNINTPREGIELLTNDPQYSVSNAAKRTLKYQEIIEKHKRSWDESAEE